MPKLSLYRSEKTNDYKFLDRSIKEMFTIGATDLYIHKYIGPTNQGTSADLTQPIITTPDPTKIQDLLFLENRDRKYDSNIYRIRGHYNVQNLDFDLSQFGLFLNNDIIFITVHYNDMIDMIGRKLMVGDVFELPHLTDYHPLNELIPVGLRRYYQITDANFASEGFTQTWYPHLWRIKCEPLVDSQEFSGILSAPLNQDNFLGEWNNTSTYVPGYVVSYGGKNYTPTQDVPANTPPPNTTYWALDSADSIKDILSRYNTNIAINDAAIAEAARLVPKAGYDRSQLYVVPTFENNEPAPPVDIVISTLAPTPQPGTTQRSTSPLGVVETILTPGYSVPSSVVRINKTTLDRIKSLLDHSGLTLQEFVKVNLELASIKAEVTESGSGPVYDQLVLAAQLLGIVHGPYGTADNTYSTADQDPSDPSFDPALIVNQNIMDFRADADPRFRYIAKTSPRGFGYSGGYMIGDGSTPNGEPCGAGITFPTNPVSGDYFLRIDYLPQQLFRWDGRLWVKISEKVRTGTALGADDQSQRATFINNTNQTTLSDGTTVPERQSLSSIFKIQTD
jgi:hypothetical protein